jgi:hypothetical protein
LDAEVHHGEDAHLPANRLRKQSMTGFMQRDEQWKGGEQCGHADDGVAVEAEIHDAREKDDKAKNRPNGKTHRRENGERADAAN